MNFKSEKGYTGVDVGISIVVLFLFVSLIAIVSYQINSSAKEIELKAQAAEREKEQIETNKKVGIEEIENLEKENPEPIEGKDGFYKKIIVKDYQEIDSSKEEGIVKKVTVQIQYVFKSEQKTIELSTILTKES